MWKAALSILTVASVLLIVGLGPGQAPPTQPDEQGAKLRVGTYDNRAVAIAWFHSEFNDLGKLREQMAEAKEAGDQARIKELSELGPKLQRKLHFQGFGRSPVTDLLEPVKDRLGEVAAAAGVDAIVFECNFAAEGVEVVDVTDELVKLFDPTTEALRTIEELKKHDPVPLEDLRDED
jgi:hypothetical protein